MKGIEQLAQQLIEQIFTATQLKQASMYLENLSQSQSFKNHTSNIAGDDALTEAIKAQQIIAFFDKDTMPIVYKFFNDFLKSGGHWLFASKQFDYFDQFVQHFQLLTEKISLINLVTSIEIKQKDIEKMAKELSKSIGRHTVLHIQVNPKILGGAQVRAGNLIFDYSLKAKFGQFKRQWVSKLTKNARLVEREE